MQLVESGQIEKTGAKPKLPVKIDGINEENLYVYRIPLDLLFYNDKNGRIATGMQRLAMTMDPVSDRIDPSYNDQIAELIEADNKAALKQTQASIKKNGQKLFGYVLDDGRIIDGNRRFTALRNLQKETGKTYYYEAVILPFTFDAQTDRIKIKKLEIAIQMGIEERQSYNPVDLALDVYNTTSGENKMMSIEDYASDANMKIKEAKQILDAAIYMRKFLEFIGADQNNFSIIKDSKTYSLFVEMARKLESGKIFGDDLDSEVEKNETIRTYFALILYEIKVGATSNQSTLAYKMRDYVKKIVDSDKNEDFNDDMSDHVDDIEDTLNDQTINNLTDLSNAMKEVNDQFDQVGEKFDRQLRESNKQETAEALVSDVSDAVSLLKELEQNGGLKTNLTYSQFDRDQIQKLQYSMRDLAILAKKLFEKYGEELDES
ncbi:hypothetical protein FC23_GL001006 [Lactobacillus psittaci DSM 15354]|uniref:Uncharacterized protein n=2 Tax=Lactobacillus psittaci TaxID=116089 RepID=A0A0R1S1L9_9LACO|nr:hypothetical protein FC23_GL001006 [Lactobacillus psittaci DSM 15354]